MDSARGGRGVRDIRRRLGARPAATVACDGQLLPINQNLLTNEIPAHKHSVAPAASDQEADTNLAAAAYATTGGIYASTQGGGAPMAPTTSLTTGGSQPHTDLQPFPAVNFVIALQGTFRSRN
jgi:microcystin-dependent protein